MSLTLIGIVIIWSIVPGPITLKIIADAWEGGRKDGLITALGGSTAILLFSLFSPIFAHLLPADDIWSALLKSAGAVYLALLGLTSIWHGLQQAEQNGRKMRSGNRLGFTSGFLLTTLSPQTAIFYLAVVPQIGFVDFSLWSGMLLLGLIHFSARQAWYSLLIFMVFPLGKFIQKGPLQRGARLTFGLLLILISSTILF